MPERRPCLLPHRAAAGTARSATSHFWLSGGRNVLSRGREQPLEAGACRFGIYPGCFGNSVRMLSSSTVRREKDFYRVLGVSPKDGPQAIRAAYLRKAKELHPDANAHCPRRHHKERLFREVTEAYEVLGDPAKREEYDAQRPPEEPLKEEKRRSAEDWHMGRDEVGEEFWRQVEQIRREKERAWRTMKRQRQQENPHWTQAGSSDFEDQLHLGAALALLRALPLLLVPMFLFYGLYKSAMARARQEERPLPPIVRDELGRAFFVDSHGRHFRVMEFDLLTPGSKDPRP